MPRDHTATQAATPLVGQTNAPQSPAPQFRVVGGSFPSVYIINHRCDKERMMSTIIMMVIFHCLAVVADKEK